jgi:Uracil DNA glycosylase superfamily
MAGRWVLEVRMKPQHPRRSEFIDGYEWIAITNLVKCGPRSKLEDGTAARWPNGHPTDAMVHHCPDHVLSAEIEILNPGVILALGGAAQDFVQRSACLKGRLVLVAPHPCKPGFSDAEELRRFDEQIAQQRHDV